MAGPDPVKAACTRFLSWHRPRTSAREWFAELAALPEAGLPPDRYGEGEAIGAFERDVAELLGKEAATFLIKGTIAQQCALRVHCDRRRSRAVALHPESHVDSDEDGAYERLHGLVPVRLGAAGAPFTVRDLDAAGSGLGAVVVELPLRRAGFRLLPWDELTAISAWCRERSVPFHLDGARLWESAPFYGRTYAELAALADSVYVSFYKGLGGLAGCVLAGDRRFLGEAAAWTGRHGGNVYAQFPYVLAARAGLERHLPRMAGYHERAVALAAVLASLDGVRVGPDPPHTNAFRLYLPGDPEELTRRAREVAVAERVWLFERIEPAGVPGYSFAEVQIGDAADDLADSEIAGLVARVVSAAG